MPSFQMLLSHVSWSVSASAVPLTHVIVWVAVLWPTVTMRSLGLSDFYNHLTGFQELSRADSAQLIRKATQVIYQIMRGNACDLTFTYYRSLWSFWREVITSSLWRSVAWCVFCCCCHSFSSSELSMSPGVTVPGWLELLQGIPLRSPLRFPKVKWTQTLSC